MTMIVFACYDDGATVMTDTLSYTRDLTGIGYTTKVLALPHLDAVVIGQGDNTFTLTAKTAISGLAMTRGFDQLIEDVPALLATAWTRNLTDTSPALRDTMAGTIFLIGYSPRAGSFQAYGFADDDDFAPFTISHEDGPWVMPAPWDNRPTFLEEARIRREKTADKKAQGIIDDWVACEPIGFDDLATAESWANLAFLIRHTRALNHFCKTPIGGKVNVTQLTKGTITMTEIFEFDDDGDEFDQLVSGSLHPRALAAPCPCGSGHTFRDCHIEQGLDQPCKYCGSGKPLRECCLQGVA